MATGSRITKENAVASVLVATLTVVVGATSYAAIRSGQRLADALPVVQTATEVMGSLTAVDDAAAKLAGAVVR
jgi:hypothetical protein